jgi:hypothetical protein
MTLPDDPQRRHDALNAYDAAHPDEARDAASRLWGDWQRVGGYLWRAMEGDTMDSERIDDYEAKMWAGHTLSSKEIAALRDRAAAKRDEQRAPWHQRIGAWLAAWWRKAKGEGE